MFDVLKKLFRADINIPEINKEFCDTDDYSASILSNTAENGAYEFPIICEVPSDFAIPILLHMNNKFEDRFFLTGKAYPLHLLIYDKNGISTEKIIRYKELVYMFIDGWKKSTESEE
jgi:hypothetical protein